MKRKQWIVLAALGMVASGCAITSSSRQNASSGEGVWYVKRPIVGNAKVFYCPPQATACYQADVVESSK